MTGCSVGCHVLCHYDAGLAQLLGIDACSASVTGLHILWLFSEMLVRTVLYRYTHTHSPRPPHTHTHPAPPCPPPPAHPPTHPPTQPVLPQPPHFPLPCSSLIAPWTAAMRTTAPTLTLTPCTRPSTQRRPRPMRTQLPARLLQLALLMMSALCTSRRASCDAWLLCGAAHDAAVSPLMQLDHRSASRVQAALQQFLLSTTQDTHSRQSMTNGHEMVGLQRRAGATFCKHSFGQHAQWSLKWSHSRFHGSTLSF